jgi:formylglycine-generating enzyme required for sulfatase activity
VVLSPEEQEFVRLESARLLDKIKDRHISHQERVKIGDRLAEIGDPRPGVGLNDDQLPDMIDGYWCKVPEGTVTLEEDAGTFDVEPGYIGKYPVTWAQYRCFLEAEDGYANDAWWKELAEREEEPGEQNRKLDNHPAETVSWYDVSWRRCRSSTPTRLRPGHYGPSFQRH